MRQISMFRIGLIVAITIVTIILITPTARYLVALNGGASEERLDELRDKAIPLGLDLQGGVDAELMIDPVASEENAVKGMISRLRNNISQDKLNVIVGEIERDGRPGIGVRLLEAAAAANASNMIGLYDQDIEGDYSEARLREMDEIELFINRATLDRIVTENIEGALKTVRDRIDAFGLSQPSISIQGGNRIRIQVAGEKNPEALIANITQLAEMQFRLAHEAHGTAADPVFALLNELGELNPDAQVPLGYEVVPYKFGTLNRGTGLIDYSEGYMLVSETIEFTGEHLRSASVIQDPGDLNNPIKVSIQFDGDATRRFAEITGESSRKSKTGNPDHLAIMLDGVVRSSPEMRTTIAGGNATIEGGFTFDEAQDLSRVLKAGSLPAPLTVVSSYMVGATLGNESILAGASALGWGSLVIVIFMALYYGMAGVISIVALALNVMIILAVMALAGATLTLSGIGGILLTVGMAVDANVLIYERIREEIDGGRSLRQAITIGFDRAFRVILDSNLTTLLTALVLLQFTAGSVFGFALTMTFGLLANLYTGLTVTYTLCLLWFRWRDKLSLGPLRPFAKSTYDFIRMRIGSWSFSGILIAAAIVGVGMRGGLQFGVDFAGGMLAEVRFTEETNEDALRQMLSGAGLDGQRVQSISGTNDYILRVKTLDLSKEETAQTGALDATRLALLGALDGAYGEGGYEIEQIASFGSETGQEFRDMAISVILLASLAILCYLWLRFELIFGVAAVIALVHDLLITVLGASLWDVEISLNVVAALMVLLGFSVNDTIVVFDRIRENVRKMPGATFKEICNVSMNQSLSRTLITSGTALLVIIVMLVIGGEGLKPFAKVLLLGTIVGTYSSSFIAAPIVFEWNRRNRGGDGGRGKLVETLETKNKPGGGEAVEQAEPVKGEGRARPAGVGVAGVPTRRI